MNSIWIQSIINGREWSWSVIGLFTIIGGLIIRSVLLSDILRQVKMKNRTWYKQTQAFYERRALAGWIPFILFVLGSMILWRFDQFFLRYLRMEQWIAILAVLFALSLLIHFRIYARAIVDAGGELVGPDTDL